LTGFSSLITYKSTLIEKCIAGKEIKGKEKRAKGKGTIKKAWGMELGYMGHGIMKDIKHS
jgi:hypothetical protein